MADKHNVTSAPNFVSAAEPARRPAPTPDAVSAKWKDNLGVWIGASVVLVSLQLIGTIVLHAVGWRDTWYPSWPAFQQWGMFSLLVGAVLFGLLMMWRSSLDERTEKGTVDMYKRTIKELSAELEEANDTITSLTVALNNTRQDLQERIALQQRYQARQEQTYTPAVMREAETSVPRQTYMDARLLVERACRNQPYSKDKMVATHDGWTQQRWRDAHKLACDAGIFRTVGNRTELLVDDINTALSMMDVYAGNAPVTPD